MSNRINGYLPVVCILFLIVGQIAEATVRRVKTDATGTPHDGSSWDQAYTDLQTAIDDSTDDDEVWVASMSGTPYKPGMARTSTFTLNSNVAIYGGFVGNESTRDARDFVNNETILSGDIGTPSLATDNCYHVVTASGVGDRTRLDGFTIRDGFSAGFGGGTAGVDRSGAGIYISGANSSPRIFNCIIRDNECTAGNGRGAGLWAPLSSSAQGTLVLNNCQFINNKAGTPGGGAFISNMAETTVTGCRFEDNQSTLETGGDNHGGGMYISGSVTMLVPTPAVTLIDCVFEGNKTARGSGGGIWCGSLKFEARGCDFIENETKEQGGFVEIGQGGGIYSFRCSPEFTLVNCRFVRNTSRHGGFDNAGGGLAVSPGGGDHTIINCEFIENSSDPNQTDRGYGGGLLNLGVKGVFQVINCLFVGNHAHTGGAVFTLRDQGPGFPAAKFINCTIAQNDAISSTGGVGVGSDDAATFDNCILWANTDSTGGGSNAQQVGPIGMSGPVVSYSCVEGSVYSGTSNINSDPLFVDTSPGDFTLRNYRLQPCSPASDAGNSAVVPPDTEDVNGNSNTTEDTPDLDLATRIVDNPFRMGSTVDMGSYELAVPQCAMDGDINNDTDVNGLDVQGFVSCTTGSGIGFVCECADVNIDGAANENDIPCFVDLLLTGTPCGIVDCDIGQRSFPDCNANGVNDKNDIGEGTSPDCNENGIPDECEIDENSTAEGGPWYCESDCADDVNDNGIPDECEDDCNTNGIPDSWDISETTSDDVNTNGVPDECEWDCNTNGIPDAWDISETTSADCNTNGIPDECEDDCNTNGVPDDCDVDPTDPDGDEWVSPDCNEDDYPDECNLSLPPPFGSSDCNTNGIPDECDIATCESDPSCDDCNSNGIPDGCDIAAEISEDIDTNGIPDECEGESLMGGGGESMMSSMGGEGDTGETPMPPDEEAAWEAFYEWSIAQCWGPNCESSTDAQFAAMIAKLSELGLPTAAVGP